MASPAVGQTLLGQYYVEAFIDSGGMGAIFRVRDLKRNVPLALKTLHSELAEDASIFKRFKREASALSRLAHPNIVRSYGLFQTMDYAFLLEEYIDGMSLKELLDCKKRQPFSPQEALAVMKALCSALGFAHANGVIHCDVKPANVMLNRSGQIFLTDFGIARHADSTTTTLAQAGAPAYMSPEQVAGEPVNAATDVYSLGILMYELFTGQKPFDGGETSTSKASITRAERLRYAHLRLAPPDPRSLNPQISEKMAKVLLRALEKSPGKRFADMASFYSAAATALSIDPASIPNTLPMPAFTEKAEPAPAGIPRKSVNPLGYAGASLAILIFLIIALNSGRDKPAGNATASGYEASSASKTSVGFVSDDPTSQPVQRPTATPGASRTTAATPTKKPDKCIAHSLDNGINIRAGYGKDAVIKGCCIAKGEEVEFIGRNQNGNWGKMISESGKEGWVSMQFFNIDLDDCDIPVID